MIYRNRLEAGVDLARSLDAYRAAPAAIVLALPRGGVPVAAAIAQALRLPLDLLLVRKLGLPHQEEFAMGAIATGGIRVMNGTAADFAVTQADIEQVAQRERAELERREASYRAGRAPLDLDGRTALVVDDGLATGASMRAAVIAARALGAATVVVAVPVGSRQACDALRRDVSEREMPDTGGVPRSATRADAVVCVHTPEPFRSVGGWYLDFDQVTDGEVLRIMKNSAAVG
jgi:predicted phosphoribosyltransferase